MARVQYGSTVTALAGSVGGHTFQRNNSGQIMRLKPRRSKANSQNQVNVTIMFARLSRQWAALDLADREAWNTFAGTNSKFNYWGIEKNASGFNWYVSVNTFAEYLHIGEFQTPPTFGSIAPPPVFNAILTNTDFGVSWNSTYDTGDCNLLIFASAPIRQLSLLNKKALRLIQIAGPNSYDSIDLKSLWESYFNLTWPSTYVNNDFFIFIAIAALDPTKCISSIFTTAIAPSSVVDPYGSELITNGQFTADTDWSKGTGWTISSGAANYAYGSNSKLSQTLALAASTNYRLTFDITNCASNARIAFTDTSNNYLFGAPLNDYITPANGSYEYFVASAGARTDFAVRASEFGDSFSIDNISLKEVL